MKVLIAGFGSIGRRHLRNLRALGVEDILLLRSHRSTLPDDEIAGLPVETDIHAALAHRPDAVIVANPTALHLQVAIPAAEQGCSILMEKPIADSTEEIPALRQALESGGGQLLVGFQFRFHPTLQKAAQLLADGAIGRVVSVRSHWGEYLPNWHPWEDYRQSYAARPELGGGVILTLCHPFDYLRWLAGEYVIAWAGGGTLGDLELQVEDCAEIGLRFHSGAVGTLHLDYLQQPPSHTLEIIGTMGTLQWDNSDATLRVFRAGESDWQVFHAPEGFERNWLFLEEMRHFLAVARREVVPVCTLEDGVRALQLALAAREALKAI
ncbi:MULTISPECIES: Gfo/Idh/MocA family protein [Anaerolinea]|uniref:Gfo/Idh/MocA family protein n=1 Tax=Anaerolinea TaxID=233189 RepID=UPI0026306D39|nr:Gfo/Idh/MocA family oxidoreductase [Anaerolinea thermophila]